MSDEEEAELRVQAAVLTEKVRRLEWVIYGVIGILFMQLAGLFVLWAKDVMSR